MSTTPTTEDGAGLRWRHQEREYALSLDDVSIDLETECLRETGMAPLALTSVTPDRMTRGLFAMLLWLARRIEGEPAVVHVGRKSSRLWDRCRDEMTWAAMGAWEWLGDAAEEDPDSPESSGAA